MDNDTYLRPATGGKKENNEYDKVKIIQSSNSASRIGQETSRDVTSSKLMINQLKSRDYHHTSDWDGGNDADAEENYTEDDDERQFNLRHLLKLHQYDTSNKTTERDRTIINGVETKHGKHRPAPIMQNRRRCSQQRKTDFICFVCRQPYTCPRTLPCLHTFCSDCISGFKTFPADQHRSGSDYLIYEENGISAENLSHRSSGFTYSTSRLSLDSRRSDILEKSLTFYRGRSKHAKLIENCIRRTHSCSDRNLENSRRSCVSLRSFSANSLPRSSQGQIYNNHNINTATRNKLSASSPFPTRHLNKEHTDLNSIQNRSHDSVVIRGGRNGNVRSERKNGNIIKCPICFMEANVSPSLEDLPRNFMIERFVSRDISNQSKSTTSNTIFIGNCNLCQSSSKRKHKGKSYYHYENDTNKHHAKDDDTESNKFNKPTIRCVDCKLNICSRCASVHRLAKKTKRHQLLRLTSPVDSQSSEPSTDIYSSTSEYLTTERSSLSESMSTIPESINREDNDTKANKQKGEIINSNLRSSDSKINNLSKARSHRPRLLKSIPKLKLPNLHRFSKLFKRNSDTSQSKEKQKKDQEKVFDDKDNKFKNGLVNGGFEDRVIKRQHDNNTRSLDNIVNAEITAGHFGKHDAPGEDGFPIPDSKDEENVFEIASRIDNEKLNGNYNSGNPQRASSEPQIPPKPANGCSHGMKCSRHPDEELHMFCVDCDLCVCRECVVRAHSNHTCQLITRHLFRSQMEKIDDLVQEVLPSMQRVDYQVNSLGAVKAKVEDSAAKVSQEVNEFMDLYVDAIQKHRDVLLTQLSALVEDRDRMLDVTRLHLLHMRDEVDRTCQFVSDLVSSASDREILSMKGLVTDRLTDLKAMEVKIPVNLDADIRFNPSDKGEIIHNFQMFGRVVVAKQPCPSTSFFSIGGLESAKMFFLCSSSATVCDRDGHVYTGNDVKLRAWVISQENGGRKIPVNVGNPKNGTRTLTFTPVDKGYHFLHVTLQGCAIRNSPFKFFVKRRSRRHLGVWHCCSYCHGDVQGQTTIACGCGSSGRAGYPGCHHGNADHPGSFHWSCCGQTSRESPCGQMKYQGHGQFKGQGYSQTLDSGMRQVTL